MLRRVGEISYGVSFESFRISSGFGFHQGGRSPLIDFCSGFGYKKL